MPLKLSVLGRNKPVSERIDKLTNSIENAITGEVLQTEFHRIRKSDLRQIKRKDWMFNWHEEVKKDGNEVYKLTIKGNKEIIEGLLSFKIGQKFIFLNLVESAKFNRGKNKKHLGVLGNLFALACKRSKDDGFAGFVLFEAKTALREHYEKELGAKYISRQRMYIDSYNADKLINQYFNT